MNFLIGLIDRVPAVAAIRAGIDGNKTYLVCVAVLITDVILPWSQGTISAGEAWAKAAPWIAAITGRAALAKAK